MWKWRDHPGIIAKLVPKTVIHGFLKQDVIIGPGEAVILIRNGVIEDVLTETRIEKVGGGFGNWIARSLGVGEDIQLLFLITTVSELEIGIRVTSKDYEEVRGICTLRIQLTPQNAVKILNLTKNTSILTHAYLERKIEAELIARVFSNRVAKYNIEELYGNIDTQKDIETTALLEMRKSFELWGINLISLYTNWERRAYDELMNYKREMSRIEKMKDADHIVAMNELRRNHDMRKQQWNIAIDDTDAGEKIKDIHVEGQIIRNEKLFESKLSMENEEFKSDMKEALEALSLKEELQRQKMERLRKESEIRMNEKNQDINFKTQQMKTQTETTERIMNHAIEKVSQIPKQFVR